jgi:hypothetical protein
VSDRAHIHMRFRPLENFLCHILMAPPAILPAIS